MNSPRDRVLGSVRRSLKRGGGEDEREARAAVAARLSAHRRGPIPDRAQRPHGEQVDLFEEMAREQAATVVRVSDASAVPGSVADYLKEHNLPPRLKLAPDPELTGLPWDEQSLLEISQGRAVGSEEVSLTGAFAGIAETGTLMLHSGARGPTTLNFLPDAHVVVLKTSQIVGNYEESWERVRAAYGESRLPRTVNFITGPSRTADIEQTIQLGAHGPRRLHIVLVEDGAGAAGTTADHGG